MWNANWKLVISNAMESYHLFQVHPETLEPSAPTAGAYYIVGNSDGTATGGRQTDEDDYVRATQRVFRSRQHPTRLKVGVFGGREPEQNTDREER